MPCIWLAPVPRHAGPTPAAADPKAETFSSSVLGDLPQASAQQCTGPGLHTGTPAAETQESRPEIRAADCSLRSAGQHCARTAGLPPASVYNALETRTGSHHLGLEQHISVPRQAIALWFPFTHTSSVHDPGHFCCTACTDMLKWRRVLARALCPLSSPRDPLLLTHNLPSWSCLCILCPKDSTVTQLVASC